MDKKTILIIAVLIVVIAAAAGVGAFFAGINYRKKVGEEKIGSAEQEAKRILDDAQRSAEAAQKEALISGKDEAHKLSTEAEKEISERRKDIQRQERRIQQKEESVEKIGIMDKCTFGDFYGKEFMRNTVAVDDSDDFLGNVEHLEIDS